MNLHFSFELFLYNGNIKLNSFGKSNINIRFFCVLSPPKASEQDGRPYRMLLKLAQNPRCNEQVYIFPLLPEIEMAVLLVCAQDPASSNLLLLKQILFKQRSCKPGDLCWRNMQRFTQFPYPLS